MTYAIGRGVRVEIGTTEGAGKTVSAVTAANPGVATSTSHGLSTKSIGYFDASTGMDQLLGQACRLGAVTTNTFELENLNTTNMGTFTAGDFTPITAWTTLTPATDYEVTGGAPEYIDTAVLLDQIKRQEAGPLSPQTIKIGLKKETTNGTAMVFVENAARLGNKFVVRITLKDGSVRYLRGQPGVPTESLQVGGVGTGGFEMTIDGFFQQGAA